MCDRKVVARPWGRVWGVWGLVGLGPVSNEIEIGRAKRASRAYSLDDIAVVPSRRTRNPEEVTIRLGLNLW